MSVPDHLSPKARFFGKKFPGALKRCVASAKNRVEVRDFSPSVSGRGSPQAEETRRRSFLPRCEKDVTRTMSLCDYAQPRRVFWCSPRGRGRFDLDEHDLQGVAALSSTHRFAVVFADSQHIHHTDRLSTGVSVKCHELPTCARCNPSNEHLHHRYRPSHRACCFLLSFFPINQWSSHETLRGI